MYDSPRIFFYLQVVLFEAVAIYGCFFLKKSWGGVLRGKGAFPTFAKLLRGGTLPAGARGCKKAGRWFFEMAEQRARRRGRRERFWGRREAFPARDYNGEFDPGSG
jgi:hypothetical protein